MLILGLGLGVRPAGSVTSPDPVATNILLAEDGSSLLAEDGSNILVES